MKYSLGISNFLEKFSHSIVFLYFFAVFTKEGFLISFCYSLELYILMGISFLFSFAAKDGETLYSHQKQDQELSVAQIMNFSLANSDLN